MSQQDERDHTEERFNANLLASETEYLEEPPFHVEIWQDPDTQSPNDYDGLFKLVSFSSRHNSYRDPSEIFACDECGEEPDNDFHQPAPTEPPEHDWQRGWATGTRSCARCRLLPVGPEDDNVPCEIEDLESYHAYKPREEVAFTLNYYEHGLCRWYVAPDASPVDMQWDGAYNAGVLLLSDDQDNRDWWDTLTDEKRREAADSFVEEYTAWSNGETYGYTITRRAGVCPTCHRENEKEVVDSCGGFIVSDADREYFQQEILFALAAELGIRVPQISDEDYETAPKLKDLIKVGEHFSYQDPYGADWF